MKTLIAAAVLLAIGALNVNAELVECGGGSVQSFSVHLSQPMHDGGVFGGDQELRLFLERVAFDLQRRAIPGPDSVKQINYRVCWGRVPALGGSDFDRTITAALDADKVLMEVWGAFQMTATTSSGADACRVTLAFLLVPYRLQSFGAGGTPKGIEVIDHHLVITDGRWAVSEIFSGSDVDLFVNFAMAARAYRFERYSDAFAHVCTALSLIRTQSLLLDGDRVRSMKADLLVLRDAVIKAARGSSSYEGGLKVPGVERQCQ